MSKAKARAIARTQQKSGGPISDYESGPDAGPCLVQQSEKVAAGQGIVSLISNLLLLCNSNFKSEVILNLLELLSSQFSVYLNTTIFFEDSIRNGRIVVIGCCAVPSRPAV